MSIRLAALFMLASTGSAVAGAPAYPPARRPPLPMPSGAIDWDDTAVAARGRDGLQLTLTCPAGGQPGSVWGTGVYTDDSSICGAAVHAGLITTAGGGTITIEIRAGEPGYAGSTRNGVVSNGWEQWHGSFVVVSGTPGQALPPGPQIITWHDTAQQFAGAGAPFTVICPAGSAGGSVWGAGIYTDDSSICAAAVHAGAITFAGGSVDLELRPGEPSYPAITSNGVSSSSWGAWSGSFVILNGPGPTAASRSPQIVVGGPRVIGWSDNAVNHRASVGQQFDYMCPAGGAPGSVWGDAIYTDDSSICGAAVHAGVISAAAGGVVTIEMVAGQPGYAGTASNGVTSSSWGSWSGSYRVR
jgi:hypothetical protein